MTVDVLNGNERIGGAALTVALRKGLGELTTRLETAAARASDDLKAEILFPIDRMKQRQSRPARAAHVRSRSRPGRGRSGRRRREERQGSVRGPHRRLQAPLPARCRQRDHPVPHVRADRLQRLEGVSLDRRAARAGRHRRFVLRQLQQAAAAARRTARLHPGHAARLPRRRLVRLGPRHAAGRCRRAAHAGPQRAGRDAGRCSGCASSTRSTTAGST